MHIIYVCDIGSTRSTPSNFGWVRLAAESSKPPTGNQSIKDLVECLSTDLAAGTKVSLGFEAPLFIPVPPVDQPEHLSQGRENERQRAWSAPAGAYVATLGLHQAAWILWAIAPKRPAGCQFTLDPTEWRREQPGAMLFCWEAFVSEAAHALESDPQQHLRDAATAAICFQLCQTDFARHHAVHAKHSLSLIGAAALWSGWCSDIGVLHKEALVLRPETRYEGDIVNI